MGIQINGQNDTISATDGSLTIDGATVNATGLTGTPNVNVGVLTAASAVISGNLQVDGTITTLDTLLTEVDKLEVGANNTTVGVAITQSGSGDILRLYDGASQVVTVEDGGNVGIGTDDPDSTLTIRSSGANGISLQKDSGNQLLSSRIFLGSSSGSASIFNNTGSIVFHTGAIIGNTSGDEKVRITSSGNIGIGTNNPTSNLTIAEDGASTNAELAINYTGSGNRTSAIRFQRSGTNYGYIAGAGFMLTTGAQDDLAIAPVSGKNLLFGIGNSEKLRISSTGLVGIGTTNPNGVKLHLQDSGSPGIRIVRDDAADYAFNLTASGAFYIYDDTADAHRFQLHSDGKIAFGNYTPTYDLDLLKTSSGVGATMRVGSTATSGVNNASVIINNGGTGNASLDFKYESAATPRASIYVYRSDQELRFDTAGTERLRITSTGAIGIGSNFTAIETAGGGGITLDSGVGGGQIGVFLKSTGYTGNQTKLWQDSANAVSYLESTERPLIIKAGDSSGSDYLRIDVAGSERFRISSTGNVLIDSASNGTRYTQYQILTGSKTFGTTSGVWTDVARIGHSHAIEITYMVVQGGGYSFGGAHGTSLMNTRYGSSSGEQVLHRNTGAMNGGEITGHELRYLNSGGTTDYLLQARVTFTGTTNGTFTMGYSIKGHSSDLMYSV